jgi:cytochrome o ubiquinol oxidase operon protein cyoD
MKPETLRHLTGFFLAAVLTIVPFVCVGFDLLDRATAMTMVAIAAVMQILVHLHFFLGIRLSTKPNDNLIALAFAGLLIFIMVGGTLWVMYDLNARMAY